MLSINDFALWSAEEVGEWLDSVGYGRVVSFVHCCIYLSFIFGSSTGVETEVLLAS